MSEGQKGQPSVASDLTFRIARSPLAISQAAAIGTNPSAAALFQIHLGLPSTQLVAEATR